MRLDIARRRGKQRDWEKVVIAHGSVEFCEATPFDLVDESTNPCTDARWTETCVAPRHVDASRVFYYFLLLLC